MAKNKIQSTFLNILQPKFYSQFRCIGGTCPVSCCCDWARIDWSKEEVNKLKTALEQGKLTPGKEKLKKLLTNAYKEKNDGNYIIDEVNGKCPLLTEDGFCLIQRELGEDYLSLTCRYFPRRFAKYSDMYIKNVDCSCCEVVRSICRSKDAMELINSRENYIPYYNFPDKKRFEKCPELKYHYDMFRFIYEIIADSSRSVETSFVLGALAAQKLDQFAAKGQAERIPEVISALKPMLNDPGQTARLEAARPNYSMKLLFGKHVMAAVGKWNFIKNICNEENEPDMALYTEGERKFSEFYSSRPYALRNIALNLVLELQLPFPSYERSIYENYCFFTACFAAVKLAGASAFADSGASPDVCEENFILNVSRTDRGISHSNNNIGKVIDFLKDNNCISPAHLLLLLK